MKTREVECLICGKIFKWLPSHLTANNVINKILEFHGLPSLLCSKQLMFDDKIGDEDF